MRKLFAIATMITGTLFMVSCSDDDEDTATPAGPEVSTSSTITQVNKGATVDITFDVTAAGGFSSSSVSASGGSAVVSTDGTSGSTGNQTITVTFTAGATAGAGSVTLTVTDNNNLNGSATAVVQINDTPAPTVTAPAIGDVANGSTGNAASFTVSVASGLTATYAVSVSGEIALTSAASGDVSGSSVDVTFDANEPDAAASGSITVTVTDSDGKSSSASASVLVLAPGNDPITISQIPATASITFGDDLANVPFQVDGLDGITSFTASINGNAPVDMATISTPAPALDGSETTISGTFTVPSSVLSDQGQIGANTVVFNATDTDGDLAVFTHVLTVVSGEAEVVVVRGNITEDTEWESTKVYQLDTRVTVEAGVTLTIQPGTVVKGNEGQAAAATALLIARGATLNAQGTASLPIIFTSVLDPIQPSDIVSGNYASTTSETQSGLWGGVLVLGFAPITGEDPITEVENQTELQIEGIPTSDPNGLYGGSEPTDNSGTISYISIRHGGTNIGAGNEINGLTLGAVGSGTSISWVEVVANADDGIEWFGGDVDVNGALIWNSFDDAMDTDQDWNGTCSNFIVVTPRTGSAFELDGPEGSNTRGENHVFDDGIVYVGDEADHIVDWDDNTNAALTDIYFFGVTSGNIETFEGGAGAGTSTGWETDVTAADPDGRFTGVTEGAITYGVAVADRTVGTDVSAFDWTWAGNSGALAGLGL